MSRHSFKPELPENFVIPELVPDDEPVEVPPLEPTNIGVLGFNTMRPDPAPRKPEPSTHAYAGQRSEQVEHFTELAANADRDRRHQIVEDGLATRALDTTVYPRPFVTSRPPEPPRG